MNQEINDFLREAKSRLKQKQYTQAKEIATNALTKFPKNAEIRHIIGIASYLLGEYEIGYSGISLSIELEPKNTGQIENLLKLQIQSLDFDHTKKTSALIIRTSPEPEISPQLLQIFHNMATKREVDPQIQDEVKQLFFNQEFGDVLTKCKLILQTHPASLVANTAMARSLKTLGKHRFALDYYKRSLTIDPKNLTLLNELGNLTRAQMMLNDSVDAFKTYLALRPDDPVVLTNLGLTYQQGKQFEKAKHLFEKALQLNPDYSQAKKNLATLHLVSGNNEAAIQSYEVLVKEADEKQEEIYNNLGVAYSGLGKVSIAKKYYDRALNHNIQYRRVYKNLSTILEPSEWAAYKDNMLAIFDPEDHSEEAANLDFAFFKMYHSEKDYKSAWHSLLTYNKKIRAISRYKFSHDQRIYYNVSNAAPRLLEFRKYFMKFKNEFQPIFIIGMPRSGTSLVEQVLSAHHNVTGLGELDYVSLFGSKLTLGETEIDVETLTNFRNNYLNSVRKHGISSSFFTDKMPQNFLSLALLYTVFPQAKFVHINRTPQAVCWSNFTQSFAGNALAYSNDLEDIVQYFSMYKNLMVEFKSANNIEYVDVNYDDLTLDPVGKIQELLLNLQLEINEACFNPHLNTRSVATASKAQVRKKIYQSSSSGWTAYKPLILKNFSSLGDFFV